MRKGAACWAAAGEGQKASAISYSLAYISIVAYRILIVGYIYIYIYVYNYVYHILL